MVENFSLKTIYSGFIASEKPTGDLATVAEILATEDVTPNNFYEIRPRVQLSRTTTFRKGIIGLILYYVKVVVRDHELSYEEKENIRLLKTLFQVKEGEFYNLQASELSEILSQQILWIVGDREMDRSDDIYQEDLQRVFDLGYDKFVELTKDAVIKFLDTMPEDEVHFPATEINNIKSAFLISDRSE